MLTKLSFVAWQSLVELVAQQFSVLRVNYEIYQRTLKQRQPTRSVLKKSYSAANLQGGEHLCQSVISIKLQSNFIKVALRHRCSPANLQNIFRTPFPRNTSDWLLLLKDSTTSLLTQRMLLLTMTCWYLKSFPYLLSLAGLNCLKDCVFLFLDFYY